VTILVRDPSLVKTPGAGLKVLTGELRDGAQVRQAIVGAGSVISVLGPRQNKPIYEVSAAIENIVDIMKESGVRRLIVTVGAGVRDPHDAPGLSDRLLNTLVRTMARHVYEDMRRVVVNVQASDLAWTIVRVPMLTDQPFSGKVRVGYVGKSVGSRLGRADLADFLLKQVIDQSYLHRAPAISN
jgi:putative NADH-flavin reductase